MGRCSLWLGHGCWIFRLGYLGDYYHWRVCSPDFHEVGAHWRLAAISQPAPASFRQGHPSASPLPRGSLPGQPPAGCLQRHPPLSPGKSMNIFVVPPNAGAVSLLHSTLYFFCPCGPLPLHFPPSPGATSLILLEIPTGAVFPWPSGEESPSPHPWGRLRVHYHLSRRKPQSGPTPPVHELLASLPRAWRGERSSSQCWHNQ